MFRALPVTVAVMAALAGCASANTVGTKPLVSPATPKITVASESPGPTSDSEMDLAASFARAVYTDDWDQAGTFVADNTIAARYVTHQAAAAQVDDLNGTSTSTDPSDIDVTADNTSKTLTVEDRSGDAPSTRVWQDFTFDGGKIASWEVKGQPNLTSRLWSTNSADKSEGVTAELVSAYQNNSKNLVVVLQLTSSSKNVRVISAAYTPEDGFKHEDSASLSTDVDRGGKTLTYFIFTKAPVGGKLKLTIDRIDSDDNSSSYSLTNLDLKVR